MVKVSEIVPSELRRDRLRWLVTLEAYNPNSVALPLHDLRFTLQLRDLPFAEGAARERSVQLPPGETIAVPLVVDVPVAQVVALLRGVAQSPGAKLPYRLQGSALWGPAGATLPFDRNGTFDPLAALAGRLGLPRTEP
jgi:LEA14-like dessication related protein